MHGSNGAHHPNESVFLELKAPSALVIHRVSQPRYVLRVTLATCAGGTAIEWAQEFEAGAVADRIRHVVGPANEQNLSRLQAVLAGGEFRLLASLNQKTNQNPTSQGNGETT